MAVSHAASVTTLSGGIGVILAQVNDPSGEVPSRTPQTVNLLVNGVNQQFTNVVIGGPGGNNDHMNQGTNVILILKGSTPLLGTFSGTSITMDELLTPDSDDSSRVIGISSGGQMQTTIMFPRAGGADGVSMAYPPVTLGGFNFVNGITLRWNAFPGSYNLAIPTSGSPTNQTVSFPATAAPYRVSFVASGGGTNISIQGEGNKTPVNVGGVTSGSSTTITSAILNFTHGLTSG
jgi:hypothetical protein